MVLYLLFTLHSHPPDLGVHKCVASINYHYRTVIIRPTPKGVKYVPFAAGYNFPRDVAIPEQLAPSGGRNLLDISYILVRHLYLVRMILHAGIFTLENTRAIHMGASLYSGEP